MTVRAEVALFAGWPILAAASLAVLISACAPGDDGSSELRPAKHDSGGAAGGASVPDGASAVTTPHDHVHDGSSGDAGSAEAGAVTGTDSGAVTHADHNQDHCVVGFPADPRDSQLTGNPDEWKATNGDIDLVVPKGVLDWMGERLWEVSHDAWHNIRRCKNGGGIPGATASAICSHTELVPAHQECTDAEDGFEFLVMHRHMMQALRQSFPQHSQLFSGFPHFPYNATDVPSQWQSRFGTGWSAQIKSVADTLEDIENKLSQFPTEGDLGKYIQCGGMANGASSIHGALHFKWVVNSSPYSLGKQTVNIDNHMFWKLHGWIDEIWERYRVAKGLSPDEPHLTQALVEQCQQMHALGATIDPDAGAKNPDVPLPVEHGFFHENVRPILEKTCSGCHSESSPEAGMSLGGHVTSAAIVAGLVNVASARGGSFQRVVPGNPDKSWFYLKPAGLAAGAGCAGSTCNTQVMPPTGQVTLTPAELDVLHQWIADGAPAPTP